MDLIKRKDLVRTKGCQLGGYLRSSAANPGVARVSDGVLSIEITEPGAGYITAPSVTFAAPNTGTDAATGIAFVEGGSVIGILITHHGSGYTAAPVVTIGAAPEGGTLATATASLTDAWHDFNFRKNFGFGVKGKVDQVELEGDEMSYPESVVTDSDFSIELPADEFTIKFLRDEIDDEFSLLMGMGKTYANRMLFLYTPRVILLPDYDYKSNDRFLIAKGKKIRTDSIIVAPDNLPAWCGVTYSDFIVPEGKYFDPQSAVAVV